VRSTASLPTRRLLLQRLLPLGSLVAGLLVLLPRLGIEWQWFAQFDAEVVLQNPVRIYGMLAFFAAVALAQIMLVLKKKQFEKVQAAEGI
jgi:hypothetical protein